MKRQTGFTLAELLVALAITSVLATLLLSMVSATMNVWQQGRNQIDTFSNARQVLGRIADELKGAIANSQVQFAENLSSIKGSTPPAAKTSENVFFVAPYPNSAAGDLCVIAYRHNADTYELQRAFLKSDDAWNGGAATRYQATNYTTSLSDNSSTGPWRTISQGVIEFEIRSFSQSDLDTNTNPVDAWDSASGTTGMAGNAPRRIIVRLKAIDDKALARLKVAGPASNRIISQSAREFTADIDLLPPH